METKNILAKLLRRARTLLGIDRAQFEQHVDEMVEQLNPPTKMQAAALRNNLLRAFNADEVSQKTFIKALMAMKITKISINLKLTHKDGQVTETGDVNISLK